MNCNTTHYRANSSSVPGDPTSPNFFVDRLLPLPKNPAAVQAYVPEHGSFVAGLALGGPELVEEFPAIRTFVGVSFFRITQRPIDPAQSVKVDPSDLRSALEYGGDVDADVINLSLKTRDDTVFAEEFPFAALLVAAAGNFKEELDDINRDLPASFEANDPRRHQMLVVAALSKNEGRLDLWPSSARSPVKVDIAAPGALIVSFNEAGERICMSGTSAAAPLVSFAAAVLKSLGVESTALIKRRILSAADRDPALATLVSEGRRLNIATAIDVFLDQVLIEGGSHPRRGWIEPAASTPLMLLCPEGLAAPGMMAASNGKIDLANLLWWERDPGADSEGADDDKGVFEHALGTQPIKETCNIPASNFAFWDVADGSTTPLAWSSVTRIIPSPFRGVKDVVMALPR